MEYSLTPISEPEHYNYINAKGKKVFKIRYKCMCVCGKELYVDKGCLKKQKSCGCYKLKLMKERIEAYNISQNKGCHGLSNHPLHEIWTYLVLKSKPGHKQYENVPFQESWLQFINFYNWAISKWSKGLFLTRKIASFGYVEDNCYFCAQSEINMPNRDSKFKKTCQQKYGGDNPIYNKSIQEKAKKTCMAKYGCEYASSNENVKQKRIKTCIDRYGSVYLKPTLQEQSSLKYWLESFGYNFLPNYSILKTRELDMYCEELKYAIEYCGLYWHSTIGPKKRKKLAHYNKFNDCSIQNIALFTVFSDEWLGRRRQTQNILKRAMGFCSKQINYIDCLIQKIDNNTAVEFHNNNAILPIKSTYISYGIYHKNNLVGAFIFKKAKKNGLYLCGPTFVDNVEILGIKSLFEQIKPNEPIRAWEDNRYPNKIYEQLGFVSSKEISVQTTYVNRKCSNRYKHQSSDNSRGIIYDCGHRLWTI